MAKVVTLLDLGAVGASECCEYPSTWLLGGRLGFGVMASMSRSKANWMLISSNCLRRIHSFWSVASDLSSSGVGRGELVSLGLKSFSFAGSG